MIIDYFKKLFKKSKLVEGAITKVTVLLPTDELKAIQKIAFINDISVTSALRRAINTMIFVEREKEKGNKILIRQIDGSYNEVFWK